MSFSSRNHLANEMRRETRKMAHVLHVPCHGRGNLLHGTLVYRRMQSRFHMHSLRKARTNRRRSHANESALAVHSPFLPLSTRSKPRALSERPGRMDCCEHVEVKWKPKPCLEDRSSYAHTRAPTMKTAQTSCSPAAQPPPKKQQDPTPTSHDVAPDKKPPDGPHGHGAWRTPVHPGNISSQ